MTEKKLKKSEVTKAYIYDGAIELFSRNGYENTTIRDLAKELGISLGIVYYHFKSKDDILIHYFRNLHTETVDLVSEDLSSKKSTSLKLKAVIDGNMSLLQKNASITRDLINITSNISHPLSPFGSELQTCQEGAIDLFRQALSAESKSGEYLDALAFLFWFYHLGLCLCWANDSSKDFKNTELLKKVTFPLTKKLVTLTKIGVGRKLLIQISNLLKSILLRWQTL